MTSDNIAAVQQLYALARAEISSGPAAGESREHFAARMAGRCRAAMTAAMRLPDADLAAFLSAEAEWLTTRAAKAVVLAVAQVFPGTTGGAWDEVARIWSERPDGD
jgi:hypothetical protein